MEKAKGPHNVADDGAGFHSWPFTQHEFFPGQSCDAPLSGMGQAPSVRLNLSLNSPAVPQSSQTWEQVSRPDAERISDPELRHWKGSWHWDSVSFAAQPASTATSLEHIQKDPQLEADPEIKSSFWSSMSEVDGSGNNTDFTFLEQRPKSSSVEDDGLLTLKLGGNGYSYGAVDGDPAPNVKRCRQSPPEIQQPRCQVDNCSADLRNAKDYHRRHKVCELHSKSLKAPVARIMQRFCQQCSRFHPLQEFDEDRRSCRRRLAGHNRRRRKNQPDAAAALAYLLADRNPLASMINTLAQLQGKDELERLNRILSGGDVLVQSLRRAKATLDNVDSRPAATGSMSNDLADVLTRSQILNNLLLSAPSVGYSLPFVVPAESPISALASPSSMPLTHMQQNSVQTTHVPNSKQQEMPSLKQQEKQIPSPVSVIDANDPSIAAGFGQDGYVNRSNSEHPVSLSLLNSSESLQTMGPTASSRFTENPNHPIGNMISKNDRMSAESAQRNVVGLPGITQNHYLMQSNALFERYTNGNVAVQKRKANCIETVSDQGAYTGSGSGRNQRGAMHGVTSNYPPLNLQNHSPEELGDTHTSGSDRSSDSGHDLQERTYRIVFKLFDRNPGELPPLLRKQIVEWLDHIPSDMESYIRPGCVILTVFLSMPTYAWEKLCNDIEGSLLRLIQSTSGEFWRRGRILVQVGEDSASIVEGKIYANKTLKPLWTPQLLFVRPFAVVMGENVELLVRGYNLTVAGTKIICAYGGKCIDKELPLLGQGQRKRERSGDSSQGVVLAGPDAQQEQTLTFHVGPFDILGRCFIEVEQQLLRGNYFPIIVADKSICEEICTLEKELESSLLDGGPLDKTRCSSEETQTKRIADISHFLHELGWLFQRSQWKMGHLGADTNSVLEFSSTRFRWLLHFAVEHSWCAVVKKILDLLFGTEDEPAERSVLKAVETLSEEVNLLHRAVRTNSRPMVELLLAYSPPNIVHESRKSYFFSPDMPGPAGLTPLHIAASMRAADGLIDALTNAPEQLWVSAWTSAKDATGQTPLMYAMAAGNHASVKIVQNKLWKLGREEVSREVVLNRTQPANGIPSADLALNIMPFVDGGKETKRNLRVLSSPVSNKTTFQECTCKEQNLLFSKRFSPNYYGTKGSMYRPFVLSILAVAAVCVCVGVLMKGPPEVLYVQPPFVWEIVKFGFI